MIQWLSRVARRMLLAGLLVVVTLVGTELAFQAFFEVRRQMSGNGDMLYRYQHGSHRGFEHTIQAVDAGEEHLSDTYLSMVRKPVMSDGTGYTAGEHGFRASCCAAEEAPEKVFFVFGGSTVFGVGVDDAHTISSYLNRLGADRGWTFLNYGVNAYTSSEEVLTLAVLLRDGVKPDGAIFYHGFNDAHAAIQRRPGLELYTAYLDRATKSAWVYIRQVYLRETAMLRMVRGVELRFFGDPDADEGNGDPTPKAIEVMQGNQQVARVLAEGYGFDVYHYLQPMILSGLEHDAGILNPYGQAVYEKHGTPSARAISNTLYGSLLATGHWVDLSAVFVEEQAAEVYFDQVHVGPRGNELIARHLFADLVARVESGQP